MKQYFPKHTSHGTEHHDFISFITLSLLILGLLVLLYLLYFCCLPDREYAPLTRFASAREQTEEDNEISEAALLSRNKNSQISLAPYSHRYFYITYQKNYSLQILSGSSSIRVTCYSQKGSRMNIPRDNQQYHFGKVSETTLSPGDRVFLKFANISTKPSTIRVKYGKNPAKKTAKKRKATPKPKKTVSSRKSSENKKTNSAEKKVRKTDNATRTTSKPSSTAKDNGQTTSKPSQTANSNAQTTSKPPQTANSNTQTTSKPSQTADSNAQTANFATPTTQKDSQSSSVSIKPHFLQLTVGSKKELSLSLGKSFFTLADCSYVLTDTSILSVKSNILTAKRAGITILYARPKNSSICGSCLIRVMEK